MPTSGPVYQPTTVSYEQQNEWSSQPRSYLAQTVNRVNNPRCVQWSLLALGIASVAIGCILFIEGTVYTDSNKSAISIESTDSTSSSIALAVIGIILIVIGVLLVVAYVRLVQRRKGWPCFSNKSQRLTRDLDNQTNNGQILTLNHPSTDLLVTSSQYNTVNEIPPTLSEEEETRKLMGSDIKDSRRLNIRSIVLSPDQGHAPPRPDQSDLVSSSAPPPPLTSRLLRALRAPLASVEDLTSSLESVTSRLPPIHRDSVAMSQLLASDSVDSVHTISASRFSV